MRVRERYRLPEEKERTLQKAIRLEWITIAAMISIIVVMYLTMGNSQAMRTAWREDLITLLPPVLFLVSMAVRNKKPNARFPYGYRRVVTVAYFGASLALLLLGTYMVYDAGSSLLAGEHPTIGAVMLFGRRIWLGWLMIVALIYSAIPPVILGRLKIGLAKDVHEKTLYADADMNKADWMTAVAGCLGILGIGAGFWWADSVAAALIAFDVVHDGFVQVKSSLTDLLDQAATTVDHEKPIEVTEKLRLALTHLPWVENADVRLRDEGHVLAGEAYLVPSDTADIVTKVRNATQVAKDTDWRIYDIVVTLVDDVELRKESQPLGEEEEEE
jgi:divalent metal cation (Fe/Co/Zn/Cd) transporter